MRVRGRGAAAATAGWLLAACASSGPRHPPPPDPELRIWSPGFVRWAPGADRSMRFAIENGTQRTLSLPAPDAEGARVAIFGDSETPACSVQPAAERSVGVPVQLSPGDQVIVTVDLAAACGALAPGEYRYEIGYRIPPTGGKGSTVLQTRYGTLVVEESGRPRAARTGPPGPRRP
jgi:hypothetical protein